MIGVSAPSARAEAVHEFFELFKTPWEWFVAGKQYDVVLVAGGDTPPRRARLCLVYGNGEQPVDRRAGVSIKRASGPVSVDWTGQSFPVYTGLATFDGEIAGTTLIADGGRADYQITVDGITVRRVGYDLFAEVATLLFEGQPRSFARSPALELHIDYIRRCLADAGVSYVEVPPRPAGVPFVCCLTHDIDFFGVRRATLSTLAGFVIRGTAGSLRELFRGRRSVVEALQNFLAVVSLPLVLAGLKRDPWHPFRDYALADRTHRATFFLVPFKNRPGAKADGTTAPRRAVSYGIDDIRSEVIDTRATGKAEFAVHGIDAWRDRDAGRAELSQLTAVTGQQRAGVRMHWLYFGTDSPALLEQAGFTYDSTYGYNDAVGFRAGTMQPFRPSGTKALLELPLALMDTALFYPDRMGLSPDQARTCWSVVLDAARRYGGALVINWHDRSLAPERLWRVAYDELLDTIEQENPWFATAGEAVAWFEWRRSIRFVPGASPSELSVEAALLPARLPAARILTRRQHEDHECVYRGEPCAVSVGGPVPIAPMSQ